MIIRSIFFIFSFFVMGSLKTSDFELTPRIIQNLRAYVATVVKDPKGSKDIVEIPQDAVINIRNRKACKCIVVTWQENEIGRTLECCIPFEREGEIFKEE